MGTQSDWNIHKVEFNKYKADLRRAKQISWRRYCEFIDNVNKMSRFRRIFYKDPRALGYIQRTDGSWTKSSSVILTLLMEEQFPGFAEAGGMTDGEWNEESVTLSHTSGYIEKIVTRDKLLWAVNTFDPYR